MSSATLWTYNQIEYIENGFPQTNLHGIGKIFKLIGVWNIQFRLTARSHWSKTARFRMLMAFLHRYRWQRKIHYLPARIFSHSSAHANLLHLLQQLECNVCAHSYGPTSNVQLFSSSVKQFPFDANHFHVFASWTQCNLWLQAASMLVVQKEEKAK